MFHFSLTFFRSKDQDVSSTENSTQKYYQTFPKWAVSNMD